MHHESEHYHVVTSLLGDHYQKSNPPGAVGVSIALETIIQHFPVDIRPFR